MKKKYLAFLFSFTISLNAFNQSNSDFGNWLMFFNQTRFTDNWSLHSEIQYRSYEVLPNTEQLLIRAGINYHLPNNGLLVLGLANITNYAFDKDLIEGITVSENRIWQQFTLKQNIGRFFFEHRYRAEQRWQTSNDETRFRNRLRYFLRLSVPLNNKTITDKTFYLSFYNEIFINLESSPFDRNRLYGAVGYNFNPKINLQLGALAQTVSLSTKFYLQAALFYNLDLRKK